MGKSHASQYANFGSLQKSLLFYESTMCTLSDAYKDCFLETK